MIRGIDLFGRSEISPNEKNILKAANKTATDLFKKRFSPGLKDNWDIDVRELTLSYVERDVIEAIAKGCPDGVRNYAKKAVC
jgi:hypothetical protein